MALPAAGWAVETTHNQFLSDVGHAIIHSKVLVVDPLSDDPTIVTGSHNFSKSASEKNDENFIVVKGDKALAEAYAVNVESAYHHYAGRASGNAHAALTGVDFLRARWEDQRREEKFWRIGTGAPVSPTT
jgi:phosphatidylserine/phosphatidylglycerophosphate/cardiolipin synthase-like enzyme